METLPSGRGSGLAEDVQDYGEDVRLGVRMYVKILEDKKIPSSEEMEEYRDLVIVTGSSLPRFGRCRNEESVKRVRQGELGIDEIYRGLFLTEKQTWMGLSAL